MRASVHTIGGLSAHADRDTLLGWLGHFTAPPSRTFVVHGEVATACGFADTIAGNLGGSVEAPARFPDSLVGGATRRSGHVRRRRHRGSAYLARMAAKIERDGPERNQNDRNQGGDNGTGELPDE